MMTVNRFYIDLSMISSRMTGVGVYSIRLAQYLEKRFECTVITPPYHRHYFNNAVVSPPPMAIRKIPLWRQPAWLGDGRLRLQPETFVFCPHARGYLMHQNQIVTVHDLIPHFYPTRNFVENAYFQYALPRLVKRIRGVFTGSEVARTEICNYYGIDPAQVHVVPSGVDLDIWKPGPLQEYAGEPYLLAVSMNRPYKNILELLDHRDLWLGQYRLKLVSTQARYGILLRQTVKTLGLEKVVDFLDDLSEDTLVDLYRNSVAAVYPSLMEGFGRPPLEAMAVGSPVILSDIPVHKEIFGRAGIFITPGQPATWEAAFTALKDKQVIADKIREGLEVARGYSWKAAGKKLTVGLLSIEPALKKFCKE